MNDKLRLTESSASPKSTSSSFSLSGKGWRQFQCSKTRGPVTDVLEVVLFLGEDAQEEFALLVGVEGGRHDGVDARRQFEAAADFAQVDERRRARHRRRVLEELGVQRLGRRVRILQLSK